MVRLSMRIYSFHNLPYRRLKVAVAKFLLPLLRQEREHCRLVNVLQRPREMDVRVTCGMSSPFFFFLGREFCHKALYSYTDACMTSLFSRSWMCRLCGKELCVECFEEMANPARNESEIPTYYAVFYNILKPCATIHSSQIQTAHTIISRTICAGSTTCLPCPKDAAHFKTDFVPVTRFSISLLDDRMTQMSNLLVEEALEPEGFQPENCRGILIRQQEKNDGPSLDIRIYSEPSHLTDEEFRSIWPKEPLLVQGTLPRFKLEWSPEYFKRNYGSTTCHIANCEDDRMKPMETTVYEYLSTFGKYKDRGRDVYKLKVNRLLSYKSIANKFAGLASGKRFEG